MKKMQATWIAKNPWKEFSKTRSTMWVKDENLSSQNVTVTAPIGDEKSRPPAHPLGGPLRACVFKLLLEIVSEALPKDFPFAQHLKIAIEQPASIFANIMFRGSARHKDPMEEGFWTWAVMIIDFIDQDAKNLLKNLKVLNNISPNMIA